MDEIKENVNALANDLTQAAIDYEKLNPLAADKLFSIYRLKTILENEALETLLWSPRQGELRVSCLDASTEIASLLNTFSTNILMSATLTPNETFLQNIGLSSEETRCVQAPTPWRNDAYSIAIDTRVDTRLKTRAHFYETTATTILQLTHACTRPVVVFFPSYRYAETIKTYLQAKDSFINIAMQPRSVDLNGQLLFVEESLLTAHVIFFILGSSFSESIDHLGGKIESALVVGPALPEVNPIQKAQLQRFQFEGQQRAFQRVYQTPAMRKINQALGRLVRAPGQSAKVLLHCKRFADKTYQALLAAEYQEGTLIKNEGDLAQWLK